MGLCVSASEREAVAKHRHINRALLKEQLAVKPRKILLLGSGESGKSTVVKQMKILHGNGFSDAELYERKAVVLSNVAVSMATLLDAMHRLDIPLDHADREHDARLVIDWVSIGADGEPFTPIMQSAVRQLWRDGGVREAYARRSEFQLNETCHYFFDALERVCRADYVPSEQDVLYSRAPTTGVVELELLVKQRFIFRVFDVGGQRSERRKWIHCFDDVDAVIFVTALSEFDQMLREDEQMNRMQESLKLFKSVCNSQWFVDTSMILFLNKKDLFAEKLNRVSIKVAFANYGGEARRSGGDGAAGSQTYSESLAFVRQAFLACNLSPERVVYPHETCATDTAQVQYVIDSVIDSVVQKALSRSGMQ